MNLNIEFQMAGLIITGVVMIMCQGQKRLEFQTEKAYIRLLVSVIASIILDILSVLAINFQDRIPQALLQLSCEIYLLSIGCATLMAAFFVLSELSYKFRKNVFLLLFVPILVQLIILLIFPTKIFFDSTTGNLYSYGITANATYGVVVLYIIFMLAVTLYFRKSMSPKKCYSIYFWMAAWVISGLIQFINNQILLVSFSMSVACVYMYCKLENPEYHLDFTTDVFNRRGFLTLMEEITGRKEKKAVVAFSVDNFATISEIYGNLVRNRLILDICMFLQDIQVGKIFKLEDNLFAVVLDDSESVESICKNIEDRLSKSWVVDDAKIKVAHSIAYMQDVSIYDDAETVEELLIHFSNISRKEKRSPLLINQEELDKRIREKEVRLALEEAIRTQTLEMYYQPIYNIKAGRFSSMEALVRIKDREGKIIMPGEFIEQAEKNGMIIKLGELIFRKVCEFIRTQHIENYGVEYIEVNLSVVQCMQENLADVFTNIMGEYQIAPHKINLEITETAAINTQSVLEGNMKELLNYGASFSLDDYGSGYSNLTYIVGMPLKIIKIDRSLTIAYDTSNKAKVAIEYSVEMIHKLGMEIVVEGIETEEQYMNLKKLGVEFIQGFYFSKPLPQDRVLGFLQEWL
ncbi:MAG: GGDEF domain-containing phosphodiesterase [Lachnospiraceae bacterium]|nr:GGDEF domain-containing phosphodiesterase [Lachnospiraceae bacterium]